MKYLSQLFLFLILLPFGAYAQIVINEGSNKNYTTLTDEDGEHPDWVELHNAGASDVDLYNYSLSDNTAQPTEWVFPHLVLPAGGFMTVFCSGKDRTETPAFTFVSNSGAFVPEVGWNVHAFSTPFYWDGVSNLIFNVCSYSSLGYITNSVFNNTDVGYNATLSAYADGSASACASSLGGASTWRPNMKLNDVVIGEGAEQNCNTCYPAVYGNWYWGARHEILIRADELTASGLVAGNIDSIAFDVVQTDPVNYDYIEISVNTSNLTAFTNIFQPLDGFKYHSNFKISSEGETVYLYDPAQNLIDSLFVNAPAVDLSVGLLPDASAITGILFPPTPAATNNTAGLFTEFALQPIFSVASGLLTAPTSLTIDNPNNATSQVYYTLDGNDPNETEATLYTGQSITIAQSTVVKARAYETGKIPSSVAAATYLLDIEHTTPIISIVTDPQNLYGDAGIFDFWEKDWLRHAYIEYFDSTFNHNLVFSQNAGIKIDGGAGGSRYQPQHSMRIEFNNSLLGDGPIEHLIIPDRPNRTTYSDFYLRNGSNQYLVLPYKEACGVKMMCSETANYYAAWRPVTVYINSEYFGLYELREKYNTEYFKQHDNATKSTTDLLSLSYFNGGVLRAIEGSVDTFWSYYAAFDAISPTQPNFWEQTEQYFDLTNYVDYIAGESWIANTDWPQNNIKIYRSDATNYRYRFCLIDPELGLQPNGWNDCYINHLNELFWFDNNNPYIHIWQKGIQNNRFRDYFVNRYADLMNTNYRVERLLDIENSFYQQTVLEMPNEYAKWGDPNNIAGQMNDFYNNHITYRSELTCRTDQVRNHLQALFSLPQQINITLDVLPAAAGHIQISTVTPENYPWQGVYFDGLPIKIEAIAEPGYLFDHWEPNEIIADTLNPIFNDTISEVISQFTAVFTLISATQNVVSSNTFDVYPTPASKTIRIVHPVFANTKTGFRILDVNNRIVLENNIQANTSTTDVPINTLPPGVYFVVLTAETNINTIRKFIKI